ncbi:MAG: UvrB/UvrC motif-containing protein [Planctomycetaceae bacterium]|nr:UvrB/UvrC motif-containing protein [Planctomycetaceae bacterium]
MSHDIQDILTTWDYDPDGFTVRIIRGDDGKEKIQLRLDLGLLQMEVDGRPDGLRPQGCESWLDYYQREQEVYQEEHPGETYLLGSEDCARLLREGVQYYHRYLSFWHLERYELCARDTARNLRLFALVRAHAPSDREKLQFDQWRPYVVMMHARAVATPLIGMRDFDTALQVIDAGIAGVREFLSDYNQEHRSEQCQELVQLERWRTEVVDKKKSAEREQPYHPLTALRRKLEQAVAEERFEEAAELRDEIRKLEASSL